MQWATGLLDDRRILAEYPEIPPPASMTPAPVKRACALRQEPSLYALRRFARARLRRRARGCLQPIKREWVRTLRASATVALSAGGLRARRNRKLQARKVRACAVSPRLSSALAFAGNGER